MLLLSGPSGCGKSTICKRLLDDPRVVFSVSATTRPPRPGEVDGRDYVFLSKKQFSQEIERGAFIEHAEVYGNLYGTRREPMERALAAGKVFLVEIDVQGALQLKALDVPGIYVFVAPPDLETLRHRLERRGTDSAQVIERRLRKAEDEYRERVKYDHVVVNDDFERAVAEVRIIAGLDDGPESGGKP